jgi:hypothetical protein
VGSGEGAALVPEQLALEQGVLQGAAVHDRQGHRSPQAVGVNRPSDELLARPALPLDEHREVGGRGLADQRADPGHGRALADELGGAGVGALGAGRGCRPAGLLPGDAQRLAEVREVEGLRDELGGAVLRGAGDRLGRAATGGDHHDRRRRHGSQGA